MHHDHAIIGSILLYVILQRIQLIGLLLQSLLKHPFFLLNHRKLPLEILRCVLIFVDLQLKFRALLPLSSQVRFKHLDESLQLIYLAYLLLLLFNDIVFALDLIL